MTPASPALVDDWRNWRSHSLGLGQTQSMPRKPAVAPVVEEVVFNPDPDAGEQALVDVYTLLIDFILEDRAQQLVDTSAVA